MIQIQLVRVGNHLIGKTCSDRWNLEAAGNGAIAWDRNQKYAKVARRKLAALGLTLTVVRGATVQMRPTDAEAAALGVDNVRQLVGRVA